MGRDHSITCGKCGAEYGGMNDEWQSHSCGGSYVPRTDSSVRIYPGPSCEHTERIDRLEAEVNRIAAGLARLMQAEVNHAASEAAAIARLSTNVMDHLLRRSATKTPRPSRRGKGRRK